MAKNKAITSRQRTKYRIRKRLSGSDERPRLSVFRSSKHIYAQVISDVTGKTLVSASTRDKGVLDKVSQVESEGLPNQARTSCSVAGARAVGLVIAEKCKEHGIESVVFDRNGFLYHGRVAGVAQGARSGGLKF